VSRSVVTGCEVDAGLTPTTGGAAVLLIDPTRSRSYLTTPCLPGRMDDRQPNPACPPAPPRNPVTHGQT
jgi:hypothetical protein